MGRGALFLNRDSRRARNLGTRYSHVIGPAHRHCSSCQGGCKQRSRLQRGLQHCGKGGQRGNIAQQRLPQGTEAWHKTLPCDQPYTDTRHQGHADDLSTSKRLEEASRAAVEKGSGALLLTDTPSKLDSRHKVLPCEWPCATSGHQIESSFAGQQALLLRVGPVGAITAQLHLCRSTL